MEFQFQAHYELQVELRRGVGSIAAINGRGGYREELLPSLLYQGNNPPFYYQVVLAERGQEIWVARLEGN